MHILLVVPRYSSTWGEFYQFPLGLGYIAAAMKKAGHQVSGLNLNHHHGSVDELVASKVAEVNPDACATGGLSPFLSLIQDIFNASRRAKPGIINIGGGGVVSGEPGVILNVADIDIGVVGEGERTIVELLACLESGADLKQVQGIVFKDAEGHAVQTPERAQIKELGDLPWPDYDALECELNVTSQRALDSYFFHSHPDSRPLAIDMITSRSCPFKCKFCFHPTGKTYRERPLDDFFAELDYLVARYRINMVGLIDELFSLKRQRLLEFCERIKPYNLKWMVQLHVNSATEETVKAMKESGCAYISYGIESMSQPVLENMLKKSKTHRIDAALELTRKYRIGIQGNLLFGDSAETLETANESMHWWSANRQYQVNLTPLMVFPGSPDYLEALRDGLIQDGERAGYVQDIPGDLNISSMNDKNMAMVRFQVWVYANSLFNLAPVVRFEPSAVQDSDRGTLHDAVWDCPSCSHRNEYLRVILPPDNSRAIRMTCRECNTRWDIPNPTHEPPFSSLSADECERQLQVAQALFERAEYKEAHDQANSLLGQAPDFVPARLFMGHFYRQLGPAEHMLKSYGSALGSRPFDPERHCDFADALLQVGAVGGARMHYKQALSLAPDHVRAQDAMLHVDGPAFSDEQRATYFVSWSDEAPPQRKPQGGCSIALQEIQVDEVQPLRLPEPLAASEELHELIPPPRPSLLRRLAQWMQG